jgi:hypothetical protein
MRASRGFLCVGFSKKKFFGLLIEKIMFVLIVRNQGIGKKKKKEGKYC